jgi:DNA polymerase III subunit epsilon
MKYVHALSLTIGSDIFIDHDRRSTPRHCQSPAVASQDMSTPATQLSFEELGTPLAEVTFCVVDLETTGSGQADAITEFGAVKVRGGQVLGEFQTLVNPASHIPALIAVLTGITDQMVADAPKLAQVLPGFLEFSTGCVLVAHNARFDIGFLKRACTRLDYTWPKPTVIDTVALARHTLTRDEVPNVKLGTLATHFRVQTSPTHRALDDARATVEVLHALLERLGGLNVDTLEDLLEFLNRVSPQRRAKRSLAKGIPTAPGIYQFIATVTAMDGTTRRQVLYVGKSRNLRRRVSNYFTAAETRPRMEEMVRIATSVETVTCRTPLEAEVLELRLIAAHSPRYNRRSKYPERQHWLKLTAEPFPRLSLVRRISDDGGFYFGPFRRREAAAQVQLASQEAFGLRPCTTRLSATKATSACALAEMGRCAAPCQLRLTPTDYARTVNQVKQALSTDVEPLIRSAEPRLRQFIATERFEDAAALTHRLEDCTQAVLRHHRLASLAACPQIVAALHTEAGWEIHVIRHGQLASAALARRGEVPQQVARSAVTVATAVPRPIGPQPAGLIEEAELIATWLERPGVRLIEVDGDWCWPTKIGPSASVQLRCGHRDGGLGSRP